MKIKDTYSGWVDEPGDYERPLYDPGDRINWRRRAHAIALMREAAHTIAMAGAHLMAAGCWTDGKDAIDTAQHVFTVLGSIEDDDR